MEVREKVRVLRERLVSGDLSISPKGLSADIAMHQPSSVPSPWFNSHPTGALTELVDEHLEEIHTEPLQKRGIRDQALLQLCQLLESEAAMDGESGRLYTEGLYTALAARLMHCYSDHAFAQTRHKGGLTGYALRQVREYVDANLSNDISLAQLARIAGMSSHHFARLFRQSMGIPPHQYLISRRVARARYLLRETSRPLAEISHEVGYESQSHFTALFRKSTGLTPKVFRSRYRQ